MEVIINRGDRKIVAQTTFVPEEPTVMYYRDGSGDPGSPAYVEIDSAKDEDGNEIDLTESEMENVSEKVMKVIEEQNQKDDEAFWKAESEGLIE